MGGPDHHSLWPAGATKSAKRRAAKQRTLAEQLAAAGAGVRVINRGVSPGDLPPAARPTGGPGIATSHACTTFAVSDPFAGLLFLAQATLHKL